MTERSMAAPAADELLTDLVARLADNKYFLGRRYAEWCTSAPTLESAVAAAAMAQDEIGHARSFYPLLREVAGAGRDDPNPELDAETRTQFENAPFLNRPFAEWTDFIAANFLFDTAISAFLESATDSSFLPLAQRARRILEEEPLHWLHACGWVRRLTGKGDAVRNALQRSMLTIAPQTLDWFDASRDDLVGARVLSMSAGELADAYRARVNPLLAACGLQEV